MIKLTKEWKTTIIFLIVVSVALRMFWVNEITAKHPYTRNFTIVVIIICAIFIYMIWEDKIWKK